MRERQRQMQAARWAVVIVAGVVFGGAFLLDFFSDRPVSESYLVRLADGLDTLGTPLILVAVALLALVLVALAIELAKQMRGEEEGFAPEGTPLLTLRRSALLQRLVALPMVVAAALALDLWLLAPEALPVTLAHPDGAAGWALVGFFVLLTHLLVVAALWRALRNPPLFVGTDQGFLCEPGGLSMGFVRWADVAALTETEMLYEGQLRRCLVVALKEPERFAARLSAPMRQLQRLGSGFARFQLGEAGEIVIFGIEIGRGYGKVVALMTERVAQAGGTVKAD